MRRVVVTGMGAVSPVGYNAEATWQAIRNGQSGLGPITIFDSSNLPVHVAAEVKDFDPEAHFDKREVRRMDRFQWFGLMASSEAIDQAGLESSSIDRSRVGVIVSSASGGFISFREEIENTLENGPRRLSPFTIPKVMSNGASGLVSIKYGFQGPAFSVASACASGSDGIGTAYQLIKNGIADVIVAGGAEAALHEVGIGAFVRVQAHSMKTEATPSPFSRDRDGLIMGEGGAALVLEELEHARARGAVIHGEIIGYGASADAFHITAPTEDGSGSGLAIQRALDDAHLNPDDIDYISAHGTGTPLNDTSETAALKRVLGQAIYSIPISSTKSMTGHMMGATGALEALLCLQAIRDQIAPPTINYHEPDPECDLDFIPNTAREMVIKTAMSNSFGFGGHNSVLILRAFEG